MNDLDTEELRQVAEERCMPANTPDSLFGKKLFPIEKETFLDILAALDAKDAEIERLRHVLGVTTWDGDGQCVLCMGKKPGHYDDCEARAALDTEEPTDDR